MDPHKRRKHYCILVYRTNRALASSPRLSAVSALRPEQSRTSLLGNGNPFCIQLDEDTHLSEVTMPPFSLMSSGRSVAGEELKCARPALSNGRINVLLVR